MQKRSNNSSKRGQVTIFIIIALLIVAGIALILTLSPGVRETFGGEPENPRQYIQNCLEDRINEDLELISIHGGTIDEPKDYFLYEENKLQYLCYTNKTYETCVVEVPFIANSIEKELEEDLESEVRTCFNSLETEYEKNYDVTLKRGDFRVELLPKKVVLRMEHEVILRKGDETQTHEDFSIFVNNNIYELSRIASSIIDWEEAYGDADPIAYMALYPDLKVEKHLQNDGTAIYLIEDKNTGDKFQFASRSMLTSVAQLSDKEAKALGEQ